MVGGRFTYPSNFGSGHRRRVYQPEIFVCRLQAGSIKDNDSKLAELYTFYDGIKGNEACKRALSKIFTQANDLKITDKANAFIVFAGLLRHKLLPAQAKFDLRFAPVEGGFLNWGIEPLTFAARCPQLAQFNTSLNLQTKMYSVYGAILFDELGEENVANWILNLEYVPIVKLKLPITEEIVDLNTVFEEILRTLDDRDVTFEDVCSLVATKVRDIVGTTKSDRPMPSVPLPLGRGGPVINTAIDLTREMRDLTEVIIADHPQNKYWKTTRIITDEPSYIRACNELNITCHLLHHEQTVGGLDNVGLSRHAAIVRTYQGFCVQRLSVRIKPVKAASETKEMPDVKEVSDVKKTSDVIQLLQTTMNGGLIQGISQLHRAGIVWNDFRWENAGQRDDDSTIVFDFDRSHPNTRTVTQELCGNNFYAALSKFQPASFRHDIISVGLGVVFTLMLKSTASPWLLSKQPLRELAKYKAPLDLKVEEIEALGGLCKQACLIVQACFKAYTGPDDLQHLQDLIDGLSGRVEEQMAAASAFELRPELQPEAWVKKLVKLVEEKTSTQ
eukprot:TRINITY_DN10998_c0_g1_i4.p1 TRINITY_DN10998_c0_g1~~TRINITY_DN10998_c0_g1_i4.p1  ORF type:complete len:559 (+),score=92.39 TRINITY_DN10998_c0_g1_i4:133-1809(+)